MRSLFFPTPRTRFARLRWAPLAALASWLPLAVACVLVLAVVIAERASRAQDLRDMVWISILEKRALASEIVRPARDALEAALGAPDPGRIDWQQLARKGLVVAIVDGRNVRVLAQPAAIAAENQRSRPLPETDLVQRTGSAHDPLPMGEQFCLALPDADAKLARRVLSAPRSSRVVAAACFDTAAVERAARVTLPRRMELTWYRHGQGVLRVGKGDTGEPVATRALGALDDTALDGATSGVELSSPFGVLSLVLHGGSTVDHLRSVVEQRPAGPQVVHYLGDSDGPLSQSWTGYSITAGDDVPQPSTAAPWVLVVALVVLLGSVVHQAVWSSTIARRLTRRIRKAPAR